MAKAQRGSVFIIWILGGLATITPFAIDLYLPAFSQIAEDFGSNTATVSLSVSSYFVGMAIGQILYGPLLDRYGRKRPLYGGLMIFVVTSLGCMLSGSVDTLVVFRFFQALGGSVAWVAAVAMVRDFFPVRESVKVFSLLVLIIGVSPLLAPTLGGLIITAVGWQWVFVALALIATTMLLIVFLFLPEGHEPDPTISLRIRPLLATFGDILKNPQFYTYTFAGAFGFSTLFIYVAGSPMIFLDVYGVSPQAYGGIFALLSVGFIGGSQLNILLTRHYTSEIIFKVSLTALAITSVAFLLFSWNQWIGLYGTVGFLFICLSCVGLINPNANAIALAPFTKNMGSASALLGCTQIGIAALSSSGVGLLSGNKVTPIVGLIALTSWIALGILLAGRKKISGNVTLTSSEVIT